MISRGDILSGLTNKQFIQIRKNSLKFPNTNKQTLVMMLVNSSTNNILPYSRALLQHLFSLLQSCKETRELIRIHAQIVVNGLSQKNFILAKLLSLYVTSDELLNAHQVFNHIAKPSAIVWNQIIRGYARSVTPQKSIQLYNVMERTDSEPDGFTYSYLLAGCAKSHSFSREGEQLHGRVLSNGYCSDVFVQTNLINMYIGASADKGVDKARMIFDEMGDKHVVTWNSMLSGYLRFGYVDEARRVFASMPERSVVSWTTMIGVCTRNGMCKQALALFRQMWRAGVQVDRVAMLAALAACAELGDLRTGKWIHLIANDTLCLRTNLEFVSLNNALMHMYASCGVIEEAYRLFKEMKWRSTVSWTTMIIAYAKQGRGEDALTLFQRMQKEGVRPDEITFLGLLCACSYTGMVCEGRQYFGHMTQTFGIEPMIEHYGCMVDLLSRAGLLDEAHKLIQTMPMKPNVVMWGALLGSCRIHKNMELASHVAQQLILELQPGQAAGYLVLLSNVYADTKRWIDVAGVRQRMIGMGVKKPAGCSWIQVNGAIDDFVADDWTHKRASSIYDMVCDITMQTRMENDTLDSDL